VTLDANAREDDNLARLLRQHSFRAAARRWFELKHRAHATSTPEIESPLPTPMTSDSSPAVLANHARAWREYGGFQG
jgi:hypothetical protein